jgi:hypothetical protein
VSSVFCIWARELLYFQIQVFCPFLALTHSHVYHLFMYSSTSHFPLFFSLMLSVLLIATMVCSSPSMLVGWLHCTHSGLLLRSHRNCAALVGSGGWQGGQVGSKRKKERMNHTHTCGWQGGLRRHYMASRPIVVAVVSACKQVGVEVTRTFSKVFFPVVCLRGLPNARRRYYSFFCNAPVFSWKSCKCHRGAESALESLKELKMIF